MPSFTEICFIQKIIIIIGTISFPIRSHSIELYEQIVKITRANQIASNAISKVENLITTLLYIISLMLQGANSNKSLLDNRRHGALNQPFRY